MTPRSSFGTRYNQLVKLFKGRIVKTSLPVREKVRWSETLLQERVLLTANGCRCKPISNPLFLRNGEHCRWKAAWSINYIISLLRNAGEINGLQITSPKQLTSFCIHVLCSKKIDSHCTHSCTVFLHCTSRLFIIHYALRMLAKNATFFFCFSYFISINFNIRYVVKKTVFVQNVDIKFDG